MGRDWPPGLHIGSMASKGDEPRSSAMKSLILLLFLTLPLSKRLGHGGLYTCHPTFGICPAKKAVTDP